ncbi:MAG: hypothetical protein MSL80_01610 [Helicobacter sp.]|uniref:hypothetical protein n=1 Tax=Helicobacter sp. TaxID=218 RepID=UPI003750D1A8|nr:hypothetical protein [Helicobacter sp.]
MNGNIGVNEKSFDYEVLAQLTNIFNRTFEQSYHDLNTEIKIPKELEESVFEQIIEHYCHHTKIYGVEVSGVCPYKFFAWNGYILAERIYTGSHKQSQILAIQALSSAIICMLEFLKKEGVKVEESFHKKALRMAITEIKSIKAKSDDVRYGLGMNGLYMMFRMASVCELLK